MSAVDPDCHICGRCWWVDCPNDADYAIDVVLKKNGFLAFEGKVDLCAGHHFEQERRQREGITPHISLNWKAIEQAVALGKARA